MMRIALSGSHATGKSTLIAELKQHLPYLELVDEPYYVLLEKGYTFAEEPSLEDYEAQLDCSIDLITHHGEPNVVFERCPVDYLGYLLSLPGTPSAAAVHWARDSAHALASLDRIVFVPIERPDRIRVHESEGKRLRKRVDAVLRDILVEDSWGLGLPVLEVHGTPLERALQVVQGLGRHDLHENLSFGSA